MLTNISIKNIKSYNAEASLKIAPLTLIYGPNSAGKSTLWKFFLALRESTGEYSTGRSRGLHNLLSSNFANINTIAFNRAEDSSFTLNFSENDNSKDSTVFKFSFENAMPEKFRDDFKELAQFFNDKEVLEKVSEKQRDKILDMIDKILDKKKEMDEEKNNTPKFLRPDSVSKNKIKLNSLDILQKDSSLINFKISELPIEKIPSRSGWAVGAAKTASKIVTRNREKDIMSELKNHYQFFFSNPEEKFKFEVKVNADKDLYVEDRDGPYSEKRIFDMVGPNGPKEIKLNELGGQVNYLFLPTKISKDKSIWKVYFDFLQFLKLRIFKNNEKKIKEGEKIEKIYSKYINESFFWEVQSLNDQYGVEEKEFPQIDKTYKNTIEALMTEDIDKFIKILSADLETFIMCSSSFIPTNTFYGGKIFRVLFNDIPERFLDAYLGNLDENNKLIAPSKEGEEFIEKFEKFASNSMVDQIRNLYRFTKDLRDFRKSYFDTEYRMGTVGATYGINRFLSNNIHSNEEFKNKLTQLLAQVGLPFEIKSKLDDDENVILSFENKKISENKFDYKDIPLEQSGNALKSILLMLGNILRSKDSVIIFEEPENKLHPKIQGNLIEIILFLAIENKNRMIIETHSEHFILRIQKMIREKKIKPHTVAINYVYLDEDGQGSKIDHMKLNDQGRFIDKWRHGFFNERLKEI